MSENQTNTGALALVLVVVVIVLAVGGYLIWSQGGNNQATPEVNEDGVEIEGEIEVDEIDEDAVEEPGR